MKPGRTGGTEEDRNGESGRDTLTKRSGVGWRFGVKYFIQSAR